MVHVNDVVYYRYEEYYIKYRVKKIIDDLVIVNSYRSKSHNCIPISELISERELFGKYKGEIISE